uniref:Uncharacterized protein n=1 Tax=Megaselia scalaris TaxID=36166 RepID=T1GGK6_MEGSC
MSNEKNTLHSHNFVMGSVPDHSTNINLEELGIEKFDVIVTEIFDSGAFGEGMAIIPLSTKLPLYTEIYGNSQLVWILVDKWITEKAYGSRGQEYNEVVSENNKLYCILIKT